MRSHERIPLHDHADRNSGGPLDRPALVRGGWAGGSLSGGASDGGGPGGGGPAPTPGDGEAVIDHGDMGSTETISVSAGTWHRGTLDDDCTITVEGFTADEGLVAIVEVAQDGTGGWEITWDADVTFIGSDDADMTASTVTVFLLFSSAGDSTIYGVRVGGGTSTSTSTGHGAILLASDHSTPFTFDEILQASDASDFLYASE